MHRVRLFLFSFCWKKKKSFLLDTIWKHSGFAVEDIWQQIGRALLLLGHWTCSLPFLSPSEPDFEHLHEQSGFLGTLLHDCTVSALRMLYNSDVAFPAVPIVLKLACPLRITQFCPSFFRRGRSADQAESRWNAFAYPPERCSFTVCGSGGEGGSWVCVKSSEFYWAAFWARGELTSNLRSFI